MSLKGTSETQNESKQNPIHIQAKSNAFRETKSNRQSADGFLQIVNENKK